MGAVPGRAVPDGVTAAGRRRRGRSSGAPAPPRRLHGPWPGPVRAPAAGSSGCARCGARRLVLGSTQNARGRRPRARRRAAGIDVVRRQLGRWSGARGPRRPGVARRLAPARTTAVGRRRHRSSWWLGEAWRRALEGLGARRLSRAPRTRHAHGWSDVVCFAGVGPGRGDGGDGARWWASPSAGPHDGARLHSMAPLSWEPGPLVALLALDAERAQGAHDTLGDVAIGVRDLLPPPLRRRRPRRRRQGRRGRAVGSVARLTRRGDALRHRPDVRHS